MVLPVNEVTPDSSPKKQQTSTPIASSVRRQTGDDDGNFEISALQTNANEKKTDGRKLEENDNDSQLSLASLSQCEAVEIALDALGENNRLLRAKCNIEQNYGERTRDLKKQMERVEMRLNESERDAEELQKRIELEREEREAAQEQVVKARMFIEEQLATHEQERLEFEEERIHYQTEIERLENAVADFCNRTDLSSQSMPTGLNIRVMVDTRSCQAQTEECPRENTINKELVERLKAEMTALRSSCELIKSDTHSMQYEVGEQLFQGLETVVQAQCATNDFRVENQNLKLEKNALQEQLQESLVDRSKLQSQLKQLRVSHRRQDETDYRLVKLEAELHSSRREFEDKKNNIKDLCGQLRNVKNELATSKAEVNHLREVNNRSQNKSQIAFAEEKMDECEQMRRELEEMQGKMAAVHDVQIAFEAQKRACEQATLRIEDKEKTLTELQNKHKQLEHVLDETLHEKEKLSGRLMKVGEDLRKVTEEYDCLEREFECWKENANLQHLDETQKFEATIAELYKQLTNSQFEDTTKKVLSFDSNDSIWNTIPASLRDVICRVATQNNALTSVIRELQTKKSSLSHSSTEGNISKNIGVVIEALKSSSTDKEASNDAERKSFALIDYLVSLLTNIVEDKNHPVSSPTIESPDLKKVEQELQRLNAQISSLSSEKTSLNERNESLNKEIESCHKNLTEIQEKLADSDRKLQINQNDLSQQLTINQQYSVTIESGRRQLEMFRQELNENESAQSHLKMQLEDEKEAHGELLEKYNSLEETSEFLHQKSTDIIEEMQNAFAEEKRRNDRLSSENSALNQEVEKMKQRNIDSRMQDEFLHKCSDAVVQRNMQHEQSLSSEVSSLKCKLVQLEGRIKSLIFQKGYLQSENINIRRRIQQYKGKLNYALSYMKNNNYGSHSVATSASCSPRPHSKSRFKVIVLTVIACNRFCKIGSPVTEYLPFEENQIKSLPTSTPVSLPKTGSVSRLKENRLPSRVLKDRNDNVFDSDFTPIKAS